MKKLPEYSTMVGLLVVGLGRSMRYSEAEAGMVRCGLIHSTIEDTLAEDYFAINEEVCLTLKGNREFNNVINTLHQIAGKEVTRDSYIVVR